MGGGGGRGGRFSGGRGRGRGGRGRRPGRGDVWSDDGSTILNAGTYSQDTWFNVLSAND